METTAKLRLPNGPGPVKLPALAAGCFGLLGGFGYLLVGGGVAGDLPRSRGSEKRPGVCSEGEASPP